MTTLQDLCNAALKFAFETLRPGGSFVCKYYQGSEEKSFETRLKALFARVHREKPASSRSVSRPRRALRAPFSNYRWQESKEAYFVGLRRKRETSRSDVLSSIP